MLSNSKQHKVAIRQITERANAARDAHSFAAAAALYEAVLELRPDHAGLHMQAGHMNKEARQLEQAAKHYNRVLELTPEDAEIHLQLGHFHKTCGRLVEAGDEYQKALDLQPGWPVAAAELASLEDLRARRAESEQHTHGIGHRSNDDHDVPPVFINSAIFPKSPDELRVAYGDAFILTRTGNFQRTAWGQGPTLRGIDCVRGYIISTTPVLHVDIYLDGQHICREPMVPGRERREKSDIAINKYSFNAWIDFSKHSFGWHELLFKADNVVGESREWLEWRRERIILDRPLRSDAFPESDGWIPELGGSESVSLEDKINSLPSVIHKASSRSVPVDPKTILVQRLDQLGDLAVSVPALRRLREIVPNAKIVGLLGPGNEGLGRTLDVFDEILVFDFPDDPAHDDRILDRNGQLKLARILEPYNFDVAFDLAYYGKTRQLLPLSRAPVMIGFGDEEWLTMSLALHYNEGRSRQELMRHAGKTRMLIEAFAALLDSGARVVKNTALDYGLIKRFGVEPGQKFVVVHTGARIKFTRWPHFARLVEKLVTDTDLKIVVLADDGLMESQVSPDARANERVSFITGRIKFEEFDALVSFCSTFVGNDSGPKHLASLRGANVISLHSARTPWTEWGQDPSGVIISRSVPCAGCSIHHNWEECAKGVVCITGITVEEVFAQIKDFLNN